MIAAMRSWLWYTPPTVIKELVTSTIASEVPTSMFSAARNRLVDPTYGELRTNGALNQRKLLDEYVISQTQAEEVATQLAGEVVDIVDDSYSPRVVNEGCWQTTEKTLSIAACSDKPRPQEGFSCPMALSKLAVSAQIGKGLRNVACNCSRLSFASRNCWVCPG
ncbi:MAG: hypothetical protein AAFX85_08650 [Pseudomonadota bacterium]